MSWIIGRSAGSTQPSLGRVSLSLHSYQNPQFGMTINNIPLLEIKDFGPSRKGWTFCAFSLLFTPSAIRHAVSLGSYFTGSTSVPSPPPRRREGIKPLLEIKDFGLVPQGADIEYPPNNNIKPSSQLSTKKYLNFLKKYYIIY